MPVATYSRKIRPITIFKSKIWTTSFLFLFLFLLCILENGAEIHLASAVYEDVMIFVPAGIILGSIPGFSQ